MTRLEKDSTTAYKYCTVYSSGNEVPDDVRYIGIFINNDSFRLKIVSGIIIALNSRLIR